MSFGEYSSACNRQPHYLCPKHSIVDILMLPSTLLFLLLEVHLPPPVSRETFPPLQTWDSTPLATQDWDVTQAEHVASQLKPFPQISLSRVGGGKLFPLGCGTWAWNPRPAVLRPQISGENLSAVRANEATRGEKMRRGAENQSLEVPAPSFLQAQPWLFQGHEN